MTRSMVMTMMSIQDVPMKKLVAAATGADLDLTAEVAPYDWSPVVDSYSSDPFLPLSPLQVPFLLPLLPTPPFPHPPSPVTLE